jgi:hypothetical protein
MILTLLNLAAVVMAATAAVFIWRDLAKSRDPRRRMAYAFCASAFVLGAITFACLAIWH